jgi:protein transport protein SEC31
MRQATQLVSASEDDHNPVVQLWDLRNANSPVKELSGHTKGILHLDWCSRDASLLLSCGKDNRTLVWDPLVEEGPDSIIAELPTAQNWVFEVAWCPRNPGWRTSAPRVSSFLSHTLSHAYTHTPDYLALSVIRQV